MVQCIELMLKHVLRNTHPILIFEDIDNPRHTVSLERALSRLETVSKFRVGEKEKLNFKRAADYRNKIVHYEFELNRFECKKIYAQLFEFVHFFHTKYLREEVHAHISKDLWQAEARLMVYFREEFVRYNGIDMHKEGPTEIIAAQRMPFFERDGQKYSRRKYGDEPGLKEFFPDVADSPCHDCGVLRGQYHVHGCDVESCPRCSQQAMYCSCGW
jgi:hypothetical protein